MENGKHNIGIFDDHAVVATGLQASLEASGRFNVVLVADNVNQFLALLGEKRVDLALMDIVAPDISGLELFQKVRTSFPELPMVAYTSLASPMLVDNLLRTGVAGYVNKRQPVSDLIHALLQVFEGGIYVPQQFEFLVSKAQSPTKPFFLSSREVEILRFVMAGKLSKEIADELGISPNTVENHRANLFRKFNVNNVAEMVAQATQMGYS